MNRTIFKLSFYNMRNKCFQRLWNRSLWFSPFSQKICAPTLAAKESGKEDYFSPKQRSKLRAMAIGERFSKGRKPGRKCWMHEPSVGQVPKVVWNRQKLVKLRIMQCFISIFIYYFINILLIQYSLGTWTFIFCQCLTTVICAYILHRICVNYDLGKTSY